MIGKVGSTGKSTAPHIHFSVIQDKDQDGDFNDDRPDGLTDPFGWQSEEEDPWPNYSFTYKGVERTGNKSHYLWTNPIANLSSELTSNGGYFRLERYELNFPQDATADPLTVEVQYSPSVTISDSFESLGSGLYLNVIDATGNPITTFPQEFTLTIDFSDFDISKYKISSISIYSSGNGVDWAKEETDVDFANSVATATLNHASYFVLGGEKADAAPPETQILLSGEEGESGWFRSDVSITLFAQDGDEGSGVYYTGYKVDDGYFQEYKETFVVSDEGEHTIEFYSVDNSGNVEEVKLFTFHIDKTPPEARFRFDPEKLDTEVLGIDENEVEVIFVKSAYRLRPDLITLRDKAGNTLKLEGEFRRADTNDIFSFKSIRYNEGASIFFGRNFYSTAFKLDRYSKKLSYLLQNWYDKSKTLLAIIYNAKGDKSEIYTLDGSGNIQKETKQGLMLLFIKTNNSNLEFGYE